MKKNDLLNIIVVTFFLVVGVLILANAQPKPTTQAVQIVQSPPTIAELLKLVNEERAKAGVPALVEDARLDQSAQRKTDDEVKYDYFGHVSPNDGRHGYEYMNDISIRCKGIGENLVHSIYENTSISAVKSWIASPKHYEAMIDAKYTRTGFGISGNQIAEHFCE